MLSTMGIYGQVCDAIREESLASWREEMVGARGFEPPTPRSRTESHCAFSLHKSVNRGSEVRIWYEITYP